MKVSIVIPVYNEKGTVEELISRVKKVNLGGVKKEIIVVDDFSTDGSKEILRGIRGIKLFFNEKNKGKGASLKTGIGRSDGDIILVQDADLEYSPEEYGSLIKPIVEGKTKVVYGSRILKKENKQGRWWFYLGGRTVTFFTNLLYHSHLTDEPTCYKVFHKDLKEILLNAIGRRFEWEPEITAKLLKKGYKIQEVPISYNPRGKDKGKKLGFKDGIQTIWVLFKWKFKN